MKPVIVTLVFLCAGNICNAQSQKEKFITYGLQKDRAETAAARGEHAQAMAIYDSAFATLPFLGYDYYDAVLNALEAGSDERANNLLIQGTENGLVVEGLYDSTIISFLQSERCMPYLNMRDYMKACWLSRADTAKIRKMKELGSWWVMIEDANGNLTKQKASTAYDRLLGLCEGKRMAHNARNGKPMLLFAVPAAQLLGQLSGQSEVAAGITVYSKERSTVAPCRRITSPLFRTWRILQQPGR
jgi:hypothetical protein